LLVYPTTPNIFPADNLAAAFLNQKLKKIAFSQTKSQNSSRRENFDSRTW
jgi:hypothetical protein